MPYMSTSEVTEVVGVAVVPPNCFPKYVAKLQLECVFHCATQSHFLQRADSKMCLFSFPDAILNTLIHSLFAVSLSTQDMCLWLTFASVFIFVCAL